MYNDMTLENMDKKCPAKILCQAFESREIFGKVSNIKIFFGPTIYFLRRQPVLPESVLSVHQFDEFHQQPGH